MNINASTLSPHRCREDQLAELSSVTVRGASVPAPGDLEAGRQVANSAVYKPANDASYKTPLRSKTQLGLLFYEEYFPYGTTAYRAADSQTEVSAKRYRYTGKEKDEETGLYYHGARYYACWLGRWTAADPIGLGDGVNRFAYVSGNPVRLVDPGGTFANPPDLDTGSSYVPDDPVASFPPPENTSFQPDEFVEVDETTVSPVQPQYHPDSAEYRKKQDAVEKTFRGRQPGTSEVGAAGTA